MLNTTLIADEPNLRKILKFIHDYKGLDLSSYRDNFLYRRLRLRMLTAKVTGPNEYIALLQKSPDEWTLFIDALSINITEFFRDPDVYEAFNKAALAELIARKANSASKSLRLWSSACASGEEAYSLAILVKEALKERNDFSIRIWATDIDSQALEKAREARYRAQDLRKLPRDILNQYFTPQDDTVYSLNEEIRRMVKFERHNIFHTSPLKGLEVIFCRNILIYLSRPQISELFKKFHYLLNPKGYLVLGKVETLWERDLFRPVDLRAKIYQKVD